MLHHLVLRDGSATLDTCERMLTGKLEGAAGNAHRNGSALTTAVGTESLDIIPFADDNLSLLPAVKRVRNSSGLLSSQRMRDLLETLREQYDFILIDAPPILPLSDMQIFEEVVDGILLVVRAEKTPRDALLRAIHALRTDKIAGIVLNDVQQPLPEAYRYATV